MPARVGLIAPGARVAVVGAGAAGLAAARAARDSGYQTTVFEAASSTGGTWNYGDSTQTSSLYPSLRCNIPKEVMRFCDFPFPDSCESFVGHAEVYKYLASYADEMGISALIRFNTAVERVAPDGEGAWRVTVRDRLSGSPSVEHAFDAVVVANGHYSTPARYRPPGAERFLKSGGRTITHSHEYRSAKPYVGRRVVVLGAGPSGTDIALELMRSGADVFLAHRRGAGQPPFGGIIPQTSAITAVTGDGCVLLEDGRSLPHVDDVVLCTGYEISIPFLGPESGVTISPDRKWMDGLVEHVVCKKMPTLSIVGLCSKVCPFPLFDDQSAFAVAVLTGKVSLEKLDSMHDKEMKDAAICGTVGKAKHILGNLQWEYRRRLADVSGRPYPRPVTISVYNDAGTARFNDVTKYRERQYKILGDGPEDWQVFENGEEVTDRDWTTFVPLTAASGSPIVQ